MPGPVAVIESQAAPGAWRLAIAPPTPRLVGIIKEYWEVEGTLNAFREALLPNGFVEVMFNLGPPHRVLTGPSAGVWEGSWFSGLQERAIMIESLHGTHLLSVRLHPIGARELLGPDVPKAANLVVPLAALLPDEALDLHRRCVSLASPAERFELLEQRLLHRLDARDPVPDFVREAAARIEAAHGNIAIAELHTALRLSRKHLSVSFSKYLGVPAKAYARIHRFMRALQRLQESDEVEWSTLAHDVGYSDQSHLVRDFRRIGAATPTNYVRRRTPDGSALLYDADAAGS